MSSAHDKYVALQAGTGHTRWGSAGGGAVMLLLLW
jgi:hypothetical protein